MVQSLFNFNTVFIPLSSPPPNIDGTFTINKNIQSVTKLYLDYNLLNFNIKPFKIIIEWPGRAPVVINDVYIYDSIKDPLSTYSPTNSALSFSVVAPKQTNPSVQTATVKIYYENGVKHTFNINLNMSSDNLIDLDLDVLDIQNTNQPFTTVFNIQSNLRNVVFNSTDITIPSEYVGNSPDDGYFMSSSS